MTLNPKKEPGPKNKTNDSINPNKWPAQKARAHGKDLKKGTTTLIIFKNKKTKTYEILTQKKKLYNEQCWKN